jgi:hypothetical protein
MIPNHGRRFTEEIVTNQENKPTVLIQRSWVGPAAHRFTAT